jgi:hypothetical protein
MLTKDFKISSFLPPGITTIGGKTYVCPGWHEVPSDTTLEDVYNHWTKILPKVTEEKPTHSISVMIDSSTAGKQYKVTFDGTWWDCGCAGFGFRKKCRHVAEVKEKHGIKETK